MKLPLVSDTAKESCLDTAKPNDSCAAERMTHISLPDAQVGCAVLDVDEVSSKPRTFVGRRPDTEFTCHLGNANPLPPCATGLSNKTTRKAENG